MRKNAVWEEILLLAATVLLLLPLSWWASLIGLVCLGAVVVCQAAGTGRNHKQVV